MLLLHASVNGLHPASCAHVLETCAPECCSRTPAVMGILCQLCTCRTVLQNAPECCSWTPTVMGSFLQAVHASTVLQMLQNAAPARQRRWAPSVNQLPVENTIKVPSSGCNSSRVANIGQATGSMSEEHGSRRCPGRVQLSASK
eukprot:2053471-Rhodomonas_salina.1